MSAPDWFGLLKWSLSHSDGTTDSSQATMNEEDQKWLEEVMKSTIKDDPKRMNDILIELINKIETSRNTDSDLDEDGTVQLLDELKDIVEQLDMAQLLAKFGGLKCLMELILHEKSSNEIKAGALSIVGSVNQNNGIVQEEMFKRGFIIQLGEFLLGNSTSFICSKVIYAMSCAIRNFLPAEDFYIENFSKSVIEKVISSKNDNMCSKALFLSLALIHSDHCTERRIEHLVKSWLPSLIELSNSEEVNTRENVLNLLSTILHTSYGYEFVKSNYYHQVTESIATQIASIDNNQDEESKEQLLYEKKILLELLESLQNKNVIYPRTNKIDNISTSNVQEINYEVASDASPAILLLEPPQLEAASNLP
eukprot:gene3952-5668_t